MSSSFLQSKEWEQFQRSLGRKVWRVLGKLVIQHALPFGLNFLYCPRPDMYDADSFLTQTKEIAQKEKTVFFKIDLRENFQFPPTKSRVLDKVGTISNFQSIFNFQFSNPIQPQKTLLLDLLKSEEGLMKSMHEKTRYNIRLAERRGVTAYQSNNFETFWNLLQETAERDGFHTHERQYYEKLLTIKSNNFSNELFFAEHKNKIIAAALVNFYKNPSASLRAKRSNLGSPEIASSASPPRNDDDGATTYLYGASSREHKEVMAPHFLHWRIIREAKKRGFHFYDFWGIDEKRWPGVTRFKKGFGGETMEYPESIDILYRQVMYKVYTAAKALNSYR